MRSSINQTGTTLSGDKKAYTANLPQCNTSLRNHMNHEKRKSQIKDLFFFVCRSTAAVLSQKNLSIHYFEYQARYYNALLAFLCVCVLVLELIHVL